MCLQRVECNKFLGDRIERNDGERSKTENKNERERSRKMERPGKWASRMEDGTLQDGGMKV